MALKIFNPTRTGKGVDKNQPEKKRFFLFFDLFFRKFWNICLVNLMFFVTLLRSSFSFSYRYTTDSI